MGTFLDSMDRLSIVLQDARTFSTQKKAFATYDLWQSHGFKYFALPKIISLCKSARAYKLAYNRLTKSWFEIVDGVLYHVEKDKTL